MAVKFQLTFLPNQIAVAVHNDIAVRLRILHDQRVIFDNKFLIFLSYMGEFKFKI